LNRRYRFGLGDPTVPSWGEILTMGRIEHRANMILIPGIAIIYNRTVFNLQEKV
jgi:ABC-type dipeptide/oligopeptide/nickel transport system permease subunit